MGCFARIDPKYVNNREMSDCVFRVENRVFYAHKIILVNASKRFQSMLSTNNYTNFDDNNNSSQTLNTIMTPIVIDNIRYDIFLVSVFPNKLQPKGRGLAFPFTFSDSG